MLEEKKILAGVVPKKKIERCLLKGKLLLLVVPLGIVHSHSCCSIDHSCGEARNTERR